MLGTFTAPILGGTTASANAPYDPSVPRGPKTFESSERPKGRHGADNCPLCGSRPADTCLLRSGDRLHGAPGTFSVDVCRSCGAGWTQPPASEEELDDFYPHSYSAHRLQEGLLRSVQELGQRLMLNRALARPPLLALSDVPTGDLLDVGCGRGDLGAALVNRGWRVVGIDPSPAACAIAESRGLGTHIGTLESVTLAKQSFDAVVMNHSLEHVVNPLRDIAHAYQLLRPGGLIVVSVPNFASWQRVLFVSKWFPLDLPRHRTHFTPRSLHLALEREGFEILGLQSTSDSAALVATLQYALAGRLLLVRAPVAWLAYGFGALLSPVNRLVDRLHGQRALLDVVARRPGVMAVG